MVAIFQKTEGNERERKSVSLGRLNVRDLRASRSEEKKGGPWKEERKEASINSIIRK